MSSWRECKLGDILEEVIDNRGRNPEEYTDFGIPVIDNFMIKNQKYINLAESKRFLDDETFKSFIRKHIQNKDVLITLVGNGYGNISQAPKSKAVIIQNTIGLRCNGEADNDFLFYCLKFNNEEILNFDRGAVQPSIKVGDLKSLEILLPPLEEQKAIAEVLSSLDDKIDLLHRQNHTLESLAGTLFRQWFIEEAKEEWKEKPLSKIADFLNGLACQKFPPQNDIDKLPVLKIKDLKDGISENSDYATSDVKPEYIVNNGDVIFAWSASLMVKIWDGEQCVLNQHLFKVTSKDFPKWFYYHWCKYHLDNFIAISSAHATTMGHIKRGDLDEAMCVVPSNEELIKMDDEISPIFEKIETNSKQIKSLEKMRDTLLPKLLSGEMRVSI